MPLEKSGQMARIIKSHDFTQLLGGHVRTFQVITKQRDLQLVTVSLYGTGKFCPEVCSLITAIAVRRMDSI